MFAGTDMIASSIITREKLGWKPVGPDLITDLDHLEVREAASELRIQENAARGEGDVHRGRRRAARGE